jgi:hypothetical protein
VHREKSWGTRRSFYQVRNRWYFVLTGYAGRTLLLVAPALALYELGLALLLLAKGEGRTYLRAMGAVVRSLGTLRAKRRAIQASRVAPDAELLASGDLYIETGLVTRPWLFRLVRLANRVLDLYWRAIRGWLR